MRVGIIGAGIMGRGHAEVLAARPDAELTAVASGHYENAVALAEKYGAQAFATYQELFDSGTVDAVSITTPDHLHADVMVAAAAAGVHMLVEKPLTTDVAGGDRAVAAVEKAGVTAMCLYNHRWVPAYAQAHDLMAQIGAPVLAYARKNDTIFVPTEMIGWAEKTTCAWFLSSHDIDLVTWLFGDRIVEVFASARYGKLRSLGMETPDGVQIQAQFSGGAVATFESAWIYPNTFPTTVDSYVTIIGEDGTIQLDRQAESIALATDKAYLYPRNMLQRVVHGIPGGAYRDAIDHFVHCARTGTKPLISLDSSRHVTAVLAAAHSSIVSRRPEPVPQ